MGYTSRLNSSGMADVDVIAEALAIHQFSANPVGDLEERMALRTTHRRVWRGAQILLSFLRASVNQLGMDGDGIHILELGSGSGWLGLNLAAALPNAHVTLSEQPLALPALQAHVDRLRAVDPRVCARVQAVALNWEDVTLSSAMTTHWNFIIGSELTYSHAALSALTGAIAALAGPATRTLYVHIPGRKASVDAALHEEFAAAGLRLRALEFEAPDVPLAVLAQQVAVGGADGERRHESSEEESADWLPDGGLFADEDEAVRASRPAATIFDVFR